MLNCVPEFVPEKECRSGFGIEELADLAAVIADEAFGKADSRIEEFLPTPFGQRLNGIRVVARSGGHPSEQSGSAVKHAIYYAAICCRKNGDEHRESQLPQSGGGIVYTKNLNLNVIFRGRKQIAGADSGGLQFLVKKSVLRSEQAK